MPNLNYVVSANVQNANQGFQSLQRNLAQTAAASAAMGGSMAKNVQGLNQAGNAVSNLGRVLQDAPFGFIAIQNNLNPLLESFQRLKTEAGSTGGAMKALGASLIGSGGLGLALSTVSFVLLQYPDLLSAMTKEQLAAVKAAQEFTDELAKQQGSLQTELTRLSSLVQIARDYGASSATRTAAIKELQKEYPGYLSNINQENINSQATQAAIDNLTAALVRKTRVQAISNLLTKAQEDLYKAQNSSIDDNLSAFEKLGIAVRNFGSLGGGALDALGQSAKNQSKNVALLEQTIGNLSAQLDSLIRGQAENKDFELMSPEKLKKTKEQLDPIGELLRKLRIDQEELSKNPLISIDDKDTRNFDLLTHAIQRLRELKLGNDNAIVIKLRAEVDEVATQIAINKFHERMKKTGVSGVEGIPVPISFQLRRDSGLAELVQKNLSELDKLKLPRNLQDRVSRFIFDPEKFKGATERALNYMKDTANFAQKTLDPIFSAVFDNIGNGAAKTMQAVGDAVKSLVVELIRAAAQAAVLSLILNAIFPGSGGKFSFSNLFSGLSGLPKFAEGGLVPPGFPNDTYPALLSSNEAVIPLDRLRGMLGSSGGSVSQVVVTGRISGNDINISNTRQNSTRRRLYGK